MAPYRRVFWSLLLPLGAGTALAIQKYASALSVSSSSSEIATRVLVEIAPYCAPEPQEQALYILAITIPVCLAFVVTIVLRALGIFRRREWSHPLTNALALAGQLCLVAIGLKALEVQGSTIFGYRFLAHGPLLGALLFAGLVVAYAHLHANPIWPVRAICKKLARLHWLPWLLAMTWTAMFAITGLFRQEEISYASSTVRMHLPYTMGEYAAVINGRTPLVNFFSQYQNIQGLLVAPVFNVFGFGVGSFTAVMSGFTTVGFGLLYATLNRICRSRWLALVLFVPLVALAFYSESIDNKEYVANSFNYYASGPMRHFGICLLAWFAGWYLSSPNVTRLVVVAASALLVALNNLDFGIPAAIGVLGCTLLFPPRMPGLRLPARIASSGGMFLLVALSTLGLYCLTIRAAVGAWPLLGQLTEYQKSFAMLGCFMMPMPSVSMHWIIYLTAISAVVVAIYETFSTDHDCIADSRRVINGSLAFAGIAAMGPMAYYVGRSHILVLESTFFSWGFVLFQFMHRNWKQWRDASNRPRQANDLLLPIPLVATLGLCAIVSSMVSEVPRMDKQVLRLATKWPTQTTSDAALIDLIKKYISPNDSTIIAYRDAHWLALQAGVKNVFPFAHIGSLILKDQLNAVTAAMVQLPSRRAYFFGDPVSELRARLEEAGYKRIDGRGDFGVWFKEPQ